MVTANAPTLANVGNRKLLLFAGSRSSLESHARVALLNRGEMGGLTPQWVEDRVWSIRGYRVLFEAAFPTESGAIRLDTIARAIAAFERTIRTHDSDFDLFVEGRGHLSPSARRGLALFRGQAGCARCHSGHDFTDDKFHFTGSTLVGDGPRNEVFPGRIGVTGDPRDWGRVRTPTLREVARTPPYFHDGSLPTLAAVLSFYESGGAQQAGVEIHPISLTPKQRTDLIAFLTSLSGRSWVDPPPPSLPE